MNEQTAASRDLRAARGRVVALPGRRHSWHGVAALVVAGTVMLATACGGGSTTAGSGAGSGSGVGCGGSKTLAKAFGQHYVFRYLIGLPSGAKFVVESYSVYIDRAGKGGAK
jgi:hypothetical protein